MAGKKARHRKGLGQIGQCGACRPICCARGPQGIGSGARIDPEEFGNFRKGGAHRGEHSGIPVPASRWPATAALDRRNRQRGRRDVRTAKVLHQADRRRAPLTAPDHHQGHARCTLGPSRLDLRLRADVDQLSWTQHPPRCLEIILFQHLVERVGGTVTPDPKPPRSRHEKSLLQIGTSKSHDRFSHVGSQQQYNWNLFRYSSIFRSAGRRPLPASPLRPPKRSAFLDRMPCAYLTISSPCRPNPINAEVFVFFPSLG